MSKKVLLKIDAIEQYNEFLEDCVALRIVAPMPDYKFANLLNQNLGVDFVMNPTLTVRYAHKGRAYCCNIFEYHIEGGNRSYYIYGTTNDGRPLMPALKGTDFLFVIKGGSSLAAEELSLFAKTIGNIKGIQLVSSINLETLPGRHDLVL